MTVSASLYRVLIEYIRETAWAIIGIHWKGLHVPCILKIVHESKLYTAYRVRVGWVKVVL